MLLAAVGLAFAIGVSISDTSPSTLARADQPADDFFSSDEQPDDQRAQPEGDDFFGEQPDDAAMEQMIQEHHEALEVLEGDWQVRVRVFDPSLDDGIVMEGEVEREWVLDGMWLREHLVAENDQFRYESVSFIGYSPIDQVYQIVSFDSVSTGVFIDEGHLNEDTGEMLSIGSFRDDATGALVHTRTRFDISDSNRHRFVMYELGADGDERTAVEGVYERKD